MKTYALSTNDGIQAECRAKDYETAIKIFLDEDITIEEVEEGYKGGRIFNYKVKEK